MPKEPEARQAKENSVSEPNVIYVLVASILVIGFWLANGWYGLRLPEDQRGIFGDTFGAVNALFSGLAFVGVAYAIIMQRYEIALAKEDAATTKRILDEQSSHMQSQIQTDRARASEETFFKLLSIFIQQTETISYSETGSQSGRKVYAGRDAVAILVQRFRPYMQELKLSNYDKMSEDYFERYGSSLSHYFRSLEALLTFINVSNGIDELYYGGIVRGQLSDAEQGILFHYCLRPEAARLKSLVEKYSLLVGIKPKQIRLEELAERYHGSAFEARYSLVED